jgi:hypothetical protein
VLLLGACSAWGHAPLRSGGEALAWPAEAWPLRLASTALADRRAAAGWSAGGPAAWRPESEVELSDDGRVAVEALDAAAWLETVGDPALVAFTLITHQAGALLDADVVLNVDRFALVDPPVPRAFSRQAVMAHELGHVLGLGHPCGVSGQPSCLGPEGAALMAPRLPAGDHRGPGEDDWAGLSAYSTYPGPARRPMVGQAEASTTGWWVAAQGLEPGDTVVRHGVTRVVETLQQIPPALEAAPDVYALELWTTAGQGVIVDRPVMPDGGLEEAPHSAPAPAGGCSTTQAPLNAPAWALLAIALRWRKGRSS